MQAKPKITISVRFFGPLRELARLEETEIQVSEDTTISDLVWILGERFPNMREHLKVVSFAVDSDYAPKETVLKEGNVVGVLPPISGG